jgi:hypothetical protein
MNKLNLSIYALSLQGAQLIKSTKTGKDLLVIELESSRMQKHNNGKVYLNLDVIERREGADKYGNTHFVTETSSKEERQRGVTVPIIGNAKTYTFSKPRQDAPKQEKPRDDWEAAGGAPNDQDIPF